MAGLLPTPTTTTSLTDKTASAWIFLSLFSHLPTAVGPSFIICFCWMGVGGGGWPTVRSPARPGHCQSVSLTPRPPPWQSYMGVHLASLGSESLTKQLYFSRTCEAQASRTCSSFFHLTVLQSAPFPSIMGPWKRTGPFSAPPQDALWPRVDLQPDRCSVGKQGLRSPRVLGSNQRDPLRPGHVVGAVLFGWQL